MANPFSSTAAMDTPVHREQVPSLQDCGLLMRILLQSPLVCHQLTIVLLTYLFACGATAATFQSQRFLCLADLGPFYVFS